MKNLRILSNVAVVATLLAGAPALAQTPAGTVAEEVVVSEVLLDVVVTDHRGRVVLGLGENDFVVEEDGRRMDINDVTFYSHRRFLETTDRARELGIAPETVPSDRHFILFFHDQRMLFSRLVGRQLEAARRVKQWVNNDLAPSDWVAIVAYDTSLKVMQDFTNDPAALEDAIDRTVQGKDPLRTKAPVQPAGAPSMLAHFEGDPSRIYEALEVVADSTRHIRGRKNLALFSIGFGDVNEFGHYTPDARYYPDMVRSLNDANVAVYTVDLIPNGTFFLSRTLGNALSSLAIDTGGEYYSTFVNFITPLERMSADTNGYYLVSYTSEHDAESGYQEVEVDTLNPRFKVRAREGYAFGAASMAEPAS